MKPKAYKTLNGARGFSRRLKEMYPKHLYQITTHVGPDFETRFVVEVLIDDVRGCPAWVAVGPLTQGKLKS